MCGRGGNTKLSINSFANLTASKNEWNYLQVLLCGMPLVVCWAAILTPKSVTRASILTLSWHKNCTLLSSLMSSDLRRKESPPLTTNFEKWKDEVVFISRDSIPCVISTSISYKLGKKCGGQLFSDQVGWFSQWPIKLASHPFLTLTIWQPCTLKKTNMSIVYTEA